MTEIRPAATIPPFSLNYPTGRNRIISGKNVIWFENLRMTDVEQVGGKNASLGEMISQLAATGVKVPGGFATTAEAFRDFLTHNRLTERINARLASLNTDDVKALAEAGAEIRGWVRDAGFPPDLEKAIRDLSLIHI